MVSASLFGPVTIARVIIWCLIVWTVMFLVIFVPVIMLYHSRTSAHEIVTARLDGFRTERGIDHRGRLHKSTYATMSFQRTEGRQKVDCKLADQRITDHVMIKEKPSSIQVAVHPHSCYEYLMTPLPSVWKLMLQVFASGLLFMGVIAAAIVVHRT